jgi:hypothetical protein
MLATTAGVLGQAQTDPHLRISSCQQPPLLTIDHVILFRNNFQGERLERPIGPEYEGPLDPVFIRQKFVTISISK